MESLTLNLPAMFADHHVIEVRRVLSELPGVGTIYASSAFLFVEIEYDPTLTDPETIGHVLRAAGYLTAMSVPVEIGTHPAGEEGDPPFFRHSTAYAQAGKTVSFAQNVAFAGRPLWPCPGLGVVKKVTVTSITEAEHA